MPIGEQTKMFDSLGNPDNGNGGTEQSFSFDEKLCNCLRQKVAVVVTKMRLLDRGEEFTGPHR